MSNRHLLPRSKKTYCLSLKLLIELFTHAINCLQKTNAALETTFTASQQCHVSLTAEETIGAVLKENSAVDHKSIYLLNGKRLYTVKEAIRRRNEVLAHLNIMLMKLNAKVKMVPNMEMRFSTEEELVFHFSKVFHAKLRESWLFKRIGNETWRSCIAFGYTRKNNSEMLQLFSERLDLYCQGALEVSKQPSNYPLHKAVMDNSLSLIQQLCAGQR